MSDEYLGTCPVCKSQHVSTASPITRRTKFNSSKVVTNRLKCDDCGYIDRKANFRGALSVSNMPTRDLDFRMEDLDA